MNFRPPQGVEWEQLAESFLHGRGLQTLQRNFYCRSGEIDLVMMDDQTLVFTEVRYRKHDSHGSGAESVTLSKQRRIIGAAERYLHHKRLHPSQACRFDVVSISSEEGRTLINWIRGAFEAG